MSSQASDRPVIGAGGFDGSSQTGFSQDDFFDQKTFNANFHEEHLFGDSSQIRDDFHSTFQDDAFNVDSESVFVGDKGSSWANEEPMTSQQSGVVSDFVEYEVAENIGNLHFDEIDERHLEQFSEENLPEHACQYCYIHNPESVVQCTICNKWFCNGTSGGGGSHIVNHLVRARHKEIALHDGSPLGGTTMECYNCGKRNIFLLGFITLKADNVVVFLCRDPCLHSTSMKDMTWDVEQWSPLIQNKSLLEWIVKVPTKEEQMGSRVMTSQQMYRLEELWKTNPEAKVEDIEQPGIDDEPIPVQLVYDDVDQYDGIINPLVQIEADYDKRMKESQRKEDITIRWDRGLNQQRLAKFLFPRTENEFRLMPGDELRLKHPGDNLRGPWECVGHVVYLSSNEEVAVELENDHNTPENITVGYAVEYVWKSTTFDRIKSALKRFVQDKKCMSEYLKHKLLGRNDVDAPELKPLFPHKFGAPGLPPLNMSQGSAVKAVLQKPLSIIQGPPGTGKTVTSSAIVYHLTKQNVGQVLVCAPSNVAVDQLAERISLTGLKVLRVAAKSREAIVSNVEHLCLHNMVREYAKQSEGELHKLLLKRDEKGELTEQEERRFRMLRRSIEKRMIQNADVICTTCSGAGDVRLEKLKFRAVLIDECTQATEPECLIPVVRGCGQLVLVGDHCQLGPVIMCKKAARAGMSRSLFERLVLLGNRPIRLNVQYRMHPCLSEFPSNTFYEGALQNGVTHNDRLQDGTAFPWPDQDRPMFFLNCTGQEEISASGTSFLNRSEADNVEKIVTHLLRAGVSAGDIGVVTPYEGQRAHVVNHMQRVGQVKKTMYDAVEVSSVDSFQGREKEYIILSCVRSNERQGIGFLADPRRLNVALTRAKHGLIIVGNAKVLSREQLWNALLEHFKARKLLVEGPLNNLKQSMVTFERPRMYNRHQRYTALDLQRHDDPYASSNITEDASLTLTNDDLLHSQQSESVGYGM